MAFFLFTCSDSSFPTVNSMRLTRGRHLKPEPAFGVLRSNENIIQESLNTNVPVEQIEQVESGKPVSYPRVLKMVSSGGFTSLHEMKLSWKSSPSVHVHR